MLAKRTGMGLVTALAALGLSVVPARASDSVVPATSSVHCSVVVTLPAQDGGTVSLPGRPDGSTDCRLSGGDSSLAVAALQSALRFCNLRSSIAVDGEFGPVTQKVVRDFQRASGLPVSGTYDNQTRDAMTWPDNDTLLCTRPTHF